MTENDAGLALSELVFHKSFLDIATTEKSRYQLDSVYFRMVGTRVEACVSDGKIMSRIRWEIFEEEDVPLESPVLIPAEMLRQAIKIHGKVCIPIRLTQNALLLANGVTLTLPPQEGLGWPNIDAIIPAEMPPSNENHSVITQKVDTLSKVLNLVSMTGGEDLRQYIAGPADIYKTVVAREYESRRKSKWCIHNAEETVDILWMPTSERYNSQNNRRPIMTRDAVSNIEAAIQRQSEEFPSAKEFIEGMKFVLDKIYIYMPSIQSDESKEEEGE